MSRWDERENRVAKTLVVTSVALVAGAISTLFYTAMVGEPPDTAAIVEPNHTAKRDLAPITTPMNKGPQERSVIVDFTTSMDNGRTWPRLKPRRRASDQPYEVSVPVGMKFRAPEQRIGIAGDSDFTGGGADVFTDFLHDRRRARAEQTYETAVLARGVPVLETLRILGARQKDAQAILSAAAIVYDPETLLPGAALEYAFENVYVPTILPDSPKGEAGGSISFVTEQRVLARVRFRPDARKVLTAWRQSDGTYTARIETLDVEKRYAAVAGVIRNSLFASAGRADIPPEVMAQFANLFLYDIDFARDIYAGDRFEAVYEAYYDTDGNFVRSGDIVFAAMTWRGGREQRAYYRFGETESEQVAPYFDDKGESSTRLLMKTPIEGARVTSGFGRRRHPILGYSKAHKGVDFGARRGTPIMAAGDGIVERAAPTGSFGNYVKINHAHGYATAYAHMDGFAKGIAAGTRVRQGQIIGYVGSTGRSTGPHLHYEVMLNGKVQNPMRLAVSNGRSLDQASMSDFHRTRQRIDSLRLHPLTVAMATSQ